MLQISLLSRGGIAAIHSLFYRSSYYGNDSISESYPKQTDRLGYKSRDINNNNIIYVSDKSYHIEALEFENTFLHACIYNRNSVVMIGLLGLNLAQKKKKTCLHRDISGRAQHCLTTVIPLIL